MAIHEAAAEGFGRAAAAYERGRPGYPEDAVEWMATTLGINRGATVIDLGAGTGKFSRMLMRTGARVLAVEPVAAMRNELVRTSPGVEVVRRYRGAAPTHESDRWREAMTASPLFEPAGRRQFRHVQVVDPDRLVDRVLSTSVIAALAYDQRLAVADQVRRLASGAARIDLPYVTDVFLYARVTTAG